jgi:hypothetical protein
MDRSLALFGKSPAFLAKSNNVPFGEYVLCSNLPINAALTLPVSLRIDI